MDEHHRIRRLGVVVPARNEGATIADCLQALTIAARHSDLDGCPADLLVVLDSCTDDTADFCSAPTLAVEAGNVGAARAAGFAELAARGEPGTTWLATTDADTLVAPDWLAQQVRLAGLGADAVFGVVEVHDWSGHTESARQRFEDLHLSTRRDNTGSHGHVHGASMGIRASTYVAAGGFAPLAVGEDQDLSDRLDRLPGVQVVRTTRVRAVTSARLTPRASGGFGDYLRSLPA